MSEDTAVRPDTATEDTTKITRTAERSRLVVPPALAAQGFEALPAGQPNLWGIDADVYLFKPLRAWDAAQKMADKIVARTGGNVYTLVSAIMETLRAIAAMQPEVDEETGEVESQDAFARTRGEVFLSMTTQNWAAFMGRCPDLAVHALAREVIEETCVHRLPTAEEQAKPADDPTKDHGGRLFHATGAGAVDNFYRGRRGQILRIGLCALWGSCGDFFAVR